MPLLRYLELDGSVDYIPNSSRKAMHEVAAFIREARPDCEVYIDADLADGIDSPAEGSPC